MKKILREPAFPGDDPYELVWFGRPVPLRVWVLHYIAIILRVPITVGIFPFGAKTIWRPKVSDDGTTNY